MRAKALADRRQRDLELGQREASLRCAKCKDVLKVGHVVDATTGRKFCSTACYTEFLGD